MQAFKELLVFHKNLESSDETKKSYFLCISREAFFDTKNIQIPLPKLFIVKTKHYLLTVERLSFGLV